MKKKGRRHKKKAKAGGDDRAVDLTEGRLVSHRELAQVVQQAREQQGLSPEQVASTLGISPKAVRHAEEQPLRHCFRLRRKMLERLTGYTLDGPYYMFTRKKNGVNVE